MASAVVHGTGMGRRGYECFESDSLAVFTLSSPGSEEFLECFQFSRLDILGSARGGGDRMESVHFWGAPYTTSGFYGQKGRVSVSYHPINVQKYRLGRGFEKNIHQFVIRKNKLDHSLRIRVLLCPRLVERVGGDFHSGEDKFLPRFFFTTSLFSRRTPI